MWNQACSQSPGGLSSHRAVTSKMTTLHILPCTVSQLLSASQVSNDSFAICDLEINQVSVVGVVRGFAPFVTNIQFSVDDMTGPALNVKQWLNTQDCAPVTFTSPGTYVKVSGSLRCFKDQRSLLANYIRCINDPNEITSHMLEVVQAHMQLFRKTFDVNMNTTAASLSAYPKGISPNDMSTMQEQVLLVIRRNSVCDFGISYGELQTQLDDLRVSDIRTSLTSLMSKGLVFHTVDEHHFKSTDL
ncbi:replication protein A 32 kDa subunit-like [Cottoperca gobio]|uniref:Replication protein A 32 kDa subunit-like n=1 Tax=Cottoperca gobio TaxID=56716 RepID=A0A6J2QMH4_COTGO|nr:replication protein A 32 kDa subunit-like [Cottoperca gobio]